MELAWWHWAVGGILLIIAELAVPSFVLIWFGLGALVVALAVAVAAIGVTAQLALWLVVSVGLVAGLVQGVQAEHAQDAHRHVRC